MFVFDEASRSKELVLKRRARREQSINRARSFAGMTGGSRVRLLVSRRNKKNGRMSGIRAAIALDDSNESRWQPG